jgi:erythromycin esterase
MSGVPSVCAALILALCGAVTAQGAVAATPEARIAWLREHAVPLRAVDPGNGFADLEFLKSTLADVRIVGLGEATHGTHEFVRVKHRLIEFLVTEMGFSAVALEASYAACEPLNDYVMSGRGDLPTLLTQQGYIPWDIEEFTAFLQWLRAHNQNKADEQKVRLYGVDMSNNRHGRERMLGVLRDRAPALVGEAERLFARIAAVEEHWPAMVTDADRQVLKEAAVSLDTLMGHLARITGSSEAPGTPGFYGRLMRQWIEANGFEGDRTRMMAENLASLVDAANGKKFIVWAHNGHIAGRGRLAPSERPAIATMMGDYLRRRYGHAYYVFGLQFGEGQYLAREYPEGQRPGALQVITVGPAPSESFPWYLQQTGHGNLILDLRQNRDEPAWLYDPILMHDAWWPVMDVKDVFMQLSPRPFFDGVIFIQKMSPFRPTAAATKTADAGAGL